MKVKLKKNHKKLFKDLSNDKVYEVISLSNFPNSESAGYLVKLRILSDDGIIGLYPIESFDLEDNTIDSDWVIKFNPNGGFELICKDLGYENFWENFFNDEPEALKKIYIRYPFFKDLIF